MHCLEIAAADLLSVAGQADLNLQMVTFIQKSFQSGVFWTRLPLHIRSQTVCVQISGLFRHRNGSGLRRAIAFAASQPTASLRNLIPIPPRVR